MLEVTLVLAQQAEPLIKRLDPLTRAKALAALTAVVILGFTMVLLVWLAGRATRRFMSSSEVPRRSTLGVDHDDWARKPLAASEDEPPSNAGP